MLLTVGRIAMMRKIWPFDFLFLSSAKAVEGNILSIEDIVYRQIMQTNRLPVTGNSRRSVSPRQKHFHGFAADTANIVPRPNNHLRYT